MDMNAEIAMNTQTLNLLRMHVRDQSSRKFLVRERVNSLFRKCLVLTLTLQHIQPVSLSKELQYESSLILAT